MTDQRIALSVTPAARVLLAEQGYVPDFGARPLKRLIQKSIADPAALLILEGKVVDGGGIVVEVVAGELQVSPTN